MATRTRRGFGKIRKLPSGRLQASYVGPDRRRHTAPATFAARRDAEAWLAQRHADIARDEWHRPTPPRPPMPTFASYAQTWLETRLVRGEPLRARTRAEYAKLLATHLQPFAALRLDDITAEQVRGWYATLAETTGPTRRAHAYGLLRAICNTATEDELISVNPCRIRGAGQVERAGMTRPATLAELAALVEAMRPGYQAAVLLAAWCGLRFGEIAELRRGDIDLDRRVVQVRRAITHVRDTVIVGAPKSRAGRREVALPPHLLPALRDHLAEHTQPGPHGLLFPSPSGRQLRGDGALHRDFHAAREVAGRPDLRFHDLRHTGATLAAASGATLAELMRRLGHSTPNAALIYQHATDDRDAAIAAALSDFHTSQVIDLRPRKRTAS